MGRRARGEGSIYKDNSSGLWVASVRIADGRRLQRRSKTRAEAVSNKEALVAEARSLSGRPDPNRTVTDAVEQYLSHEHRRKSLSASTIARSENHFRYIRDEIGQVRLLDLTANDIEQLLIKLANRDQRPLGRDSLVKLRGLLKRSIDRSVARGDVDRNVASVAELPATIHASTIRRLSFDHQTALRFLDSCREHQFGDMWYTQVRLCLRPGEVAALNWGSLSGSELTISHSVRRLENGKPTITGEMKTESSRRTLEVPQDVLSRLSLRWMSADDLGDEALMFASASGGVIDPAGNRRALAKHCNKSELFVDDPLRGLRPPTPHELRHTGISMLADKGAPNELLAQVAGHSSTRMVDQVYRHRVRPNVDTVVRYDWVD